MKPRRVIVIRISTTIFLLFIGLVLFSCEKKVHSFTEDEEYPSSTKIGKGQALYQQHCQACHAADGSGIAGQNPPLLASDWVAEKKKLIDTALGGLSGTILVNGKIWDGEMPSFHQLSNEELAELLSFVRKEFGGNKEPVSMSDIKKRRQ
ncbi:cytochrome c [Flammeovirgaceae bacterium SG7u.111]|nr:cytochrome c [Flammeovirgaceae bacterium SG7u.132]WPO36683.1 cytochrome c [Flammeovirgaceae bacterium SG7u.111]